MSTLQCNIILLLLLLPVTAAAQISPGPLSRAHAELEGISNCTQCHIIGQKVSSDKCMNCHDVIKTSVDQRSGYHGSQEVRGKECASCHSDHHGPDFDMVHLDEDDFDHLLTGYELEGKHKIVDCRECHKPDYINDFEFKNRTNTYMGLEQTCATCHEDYHQKTLSNDCGKCHDYDAFAPASRFDHQRSDFPLRGEHRNVECIECHRKETRNGKDFQYFTAISFQNCNSCHEDAHRGNLGENCKECHVEESFLAQTGLHNFNHNLTDFPLNGKHQEVDCAMCHSFMDMDPLTVFQDRRGIATTDCATCHRDVHEGKFGTRCAGCHDEESWRLEGIPDNFNHDKTGFVLNGMHRSVSCRKCHGRDFLKPVLHENCTSCHKDFHRGQFMTGSRVTDCAGCHSTDGFEVSLYSISDHISTKFPLEGAHAATPCSECHLKAGVWAFRELGERCVDCHQNIHGNDIDQSFYPDQSCETCHISTSWKDNWFDHELTSYPLLGAHTEVQCGACHKPDTQHRSGKFKGLSTHCSSCHNDDHHEQFAIAGRTDCTRCHGIERWKIDRFNHNRTEFKLVGKHRKVACAGCHREIEVDGNVFVQYKFADFACVVCHK